MASAPSALSQALLGGSPGVEEGALLDSRRPPSAGLGFLGANDSGEGEDGSSSLPDAPMLLGSPYPYFFANTAQRRMKRRASMDEVREGAVEDGGELDGLGQPSKLVRSLVAASASMASHPNLLLPLAEGGPAAAPDLPAAYEGAGAGSAAKRKAHKRLQRQTAGGDASGKGGGAGKDKAGEMATSLVVGVVNVVVGVPALISYTAIIFQAPQFKEYVGDAAQLLFLASAIIQAVFCLRSTLPFAVGQVQDVGLIFLSAMASSVAAMCAEEGLPNVEAMGTTLVCCLLATMLVGCATILVGQYNLAGLVQYIPLQVVGGYLAYVGFFCLVAGAAVSTGMPLDSPGDFVELFRTPAAMWMMGAALLSMMVLFIAMEKFRHPAALPAALVSIPVIFHIVLLASGHSLHEAQEAGWVIQPVGSQPFWKVFELYNIHDWKLSGTFWPAILRQVPKMITLFFVVAFGSSMDVAAIQQDMPEPLDFDQELVTVGLANIATSLCGAGFTGSYIFSQTIFTKRQGVTNVANGWVIAGAELVLFLLPVSVVEFMPNFFYGSLLMVFGIDICRDWLVHSYSKVTRAEYGLLVATFLAVVAWGLEVGIFAGVVLALAYFAFEYAKIRVTTFRVAHSTSGAKRTFRQQAVAEAFAPRMAAVGLEGYIFFGSALKIGERCMEVAGRLAALDSSDQQAAGEAAEKLFGPGLRQQALEALQVAPKFLLLDFRQVEGLDATAARTFGTIANQLHSLRIDLLITGVHKSAVRGLLVAHGVIPEDADDEQEYAGGTMALTFPTMDAGAEFCEECFLAVAVRHGLLEPSTKQLSLEDVLRGALEVPRLVLPPCIDLGRASADIEAACQQRVLAHGEVLYEEGDPSEALFVVLRGSVRLSGRESAPGAGGGQAPGPRGAALDRLGSARITANVVVANIAEPPAPLPPPAAGGSSFHGEYGPGGLVGDTDFYLQSPRSLRASAGSNGCTLLELTRPKFNELLAKKPLSLNVLQAVIVRSACIGEHNTSHE